MLLFFLTRNAIVNLQGLSSSEFPELAQEKRTRCKSGFRIASTIRSDIQTRKRARAVRRAVES